MRKKPTEIDRRYDAFLKRRKGVFDSLINQDYMNEYRDTYGDPVELAEWEAENAEQNAAHRARYEAENAS